MIKRGDCTKKGLYNVFTFEKRHPFLEFTKTYENS